MTIPPWTLPPQLTSVGAAMAEHHAFGGAGVGIFLGVHGFHDLFADPDAGQGVVPLFQFLAAWRIELLDGDGLAVLAHATKITMHWLRMVAGPPLGSPEETTVRMCMDRPCRRWWR